MVTMLLVPERSRVEALLDAGTKAVAILAGCALGAWFEEPAYGVLVGPHAALP